MGRYVTVNTLSMLMFCSQCKDMRTVSAKLRGTIWRKRLVMSSRVLSCKGAHVHKGGRTAYANSQSDDVDGVVKMTSPSATSRHHRACRPRHHQVGLHPSLLAAWQPELLGCAAERDICSCTAVQQLTQLTGNTALK
jgi:hypothetical protein